VEIHAHAHAAAEEVGREGRVGREGDDGCVVIGFGAALDPLFCECHLACGWAGEEEGPHVAEEEDVHVKVDAAVKVEHDEANRVGDLDWGEGGGCRVKE